MPKKNDIVIIGAGVIGCSIAYHLAKKGITSTIIERESIGARASGKAWAVIAFPAYLFKAEKDPDFFYTLPEGDAMARWQYLFCRPTIGCPNSLRIFWKKRKSMWSTAIIPRSALR